MSIFLTHKKCNSLQEFAHNFSKTIDYKDIIIYDYDSYFDCQNDSYCCSKIISMNIKKIQYDKLINKISKLPILDQYVINRLLSFYELFNIKNYEPIIVSSCCGEKLDSIILNSSLKTIIFNHLSNLISLSDLDKIVYILNVEYDIPILSLRNYHKANIISIDIYDIKYAPDLLEKYNSFIDYSLPRAICIKENNLYTVIDGYREICKDIEIGKMETQIILLS